MTMMLRFNVRRPPFDDRRVRRALVMAMDQQGLIDRVTHGHDFPAGGGIVPPGVAGHVPGIALPYDPVAARQAMADAGYPGGHGLPPLKGLCLDFSHVTLMFEAMAAGWQEHLGLQITIDQTKTFASFRRQIVEDPPDLWLGAWSADYLDPDTFLRLAVQKYNTGWHHPEYEALVEDARHVSDQERRLAMYRQAEQILVEEAAVAPVYYDRVHVLVKPWLAGLPASAINGNILKDFVIRPH